MATSAGAGKAFFYMPTASPRSHPVFIIQDDERGTTHLILDKDELGAVLGICFDDQCPTVTEVAVGENEFFVLKALEESELDNGEEFRQKFLGLPLISREERKK